MLMEYTAPSLKITVITEMAYVGVVEERLLQLVQLEEDHFVTGYHQSVEKERQKAWHDRHIKCKQFQVGGLVLLYDSKFFKHPGKLRTHWMGPHVVINITEGGAI